MSEYHDNPLLHDPVSDLKDLLAELEESARLDTTDDEDLLDDDTDDDEVGDEEGLEETALPRVSVSPPQVSVSGNEYRVAADVTWTVDDPDGQAARTCLVSVYRQDAAVGGSPLTLVVSEPVARFEPLEPGVAYRVKVECGDVVSAETVFTTGFDTTVPAQPAGPTVGAGLRSVTVMWSDVADADVRDGAGVYEVQVATDPGFVTVVAAKQTSGTVIAFAALQPGTVYHVRVRARDASGNTGAWSTSATATTAQAGVADLQAGIITADSLLVANGAIGTAKIGDLAVTAAKINNLAVTSAKIAELSATKLSAGTLSAAEITVGTGGALRAGRATAPFHYALFDSAGIRFLRDGTAPYTGGTVALDAKVSDGSITLDSATLSRITFTDTIMGTSDAAPTLTQGSGALTVGGSGYQMGLGQRSVQARNAGAAVPLYLNPEGGDILVGKTNTPNSLIVSGAAGTAHIALAGSTGIHRGVIELTAGANLIVRSASGAVGNCMLRLDSSDTAQAHAHIRNGGNTDYRNISAAAFVVASDSIYKTGVTDLDGDEDATVAALRPRRYQLVSEVDRLGAAAPWHVGFVAQELPSDLAGVDPDGLYGYDLPAVVARQVWLYKRLRVSAVAAIADLRKRVSALEAR